MDLQGNKIYLTRSEWELAEFPSPPGVDLSRLAADALVRTAPIRTTEQGIADALGVLDVTIQRHLDERNALLADSGATEKQIQAARMRCTQLAMLEVDLLDTYTAFHEGQRLAG